MEDCKGRVNILIRMFLVVSNVYHVIWPIQFPHFELISCEKFLIQASSMYKLHFRDRLVIILSLFWELSGGTLQSAVPSAERCGRIVYNIFRVMLMSSDKHTPLAGFVVNKNVIKPYTPVLLFPPLSPPFNSPSLLQRLADLLDRRSAGN